MTDPIEFVGFPSLARLNRSMIITEKLDGCVVGSASITMADGSKSMIKDIRVGDTVLGEDGRGNVVPSQVLSTFKNGLTKDWVTVKGRRLHVGKGSAETSVRVTPNHRFYVEGRGYVRADELQPGHDTLTVHHSDLRLTRVQKSVLLGIELLSVEPWLPPVNYQKYDIETETHNYFVGNVLTHNSNAAVVITEEGDFFCQSRKRIITQSDDNFGFAKWAHARSPELIALLGPGRHYGEWWGSGIQRGYGLPKGEKRFSLFNTPRWRDEDLSSVDGLYMVPELFKGCFDTEVIEHTKARLKLSGSTAVPGFMNPEGIVVFHEASRSAYKTTYDECDSYEWGGGKTWSSQSS